MRKYEREIKSEERRAVIWLGILAVVVAFRFWLREDPGNPPYINFFCDSPCAHFTLYWIPFLNILIYFWIRYAFCMLVYFSEDIFHIFGRRGRQVRQAFRTAGHFCIYTYPGWVGFVILAGVGSYFVPGWLQGPYWFLVIYPVGYLIVRAGVWLFKSGLGYDPVRRLAELDVEGARIIGAFVSARLRIIWRFISARLPLLDEIAKRLSKGRTPPKLRRLWLKGKQPLKRRK